MWLKGTYTMHWIVAIYCNIYNKDLLVYFLKHLVYNLV